MQRALELMGNVSAPVIGSVLNKAKESAGTITGTGSTRRIRSLKQVRANRSGRRPRERRRMRATRSAQPADPLIAA